MNIVVNGKSKKIKTGTTIVELLNSEGYSNWVGGYGLTIYDYYRKTIQSIN